MSELTLDEAIKHCLEVAEQNETQADKIGRQFIGSAMDKYATDCRECASENKRLAEWLMEYKDLKAEQNDQYVFIRELMTELKEAKRLLKSAIDEWHIVCEWGECSERCDWFENGKCTQEWSGKAEALKLIES